MMLDARNDTHTPLGSGGGGDSTFDLYVNSASFWSCGACVNKLTDGCCRLVPLGVVSISLAESYPSPFALSFTAQQRIVDGRLFANLTTGGGGVCALSAYVHPQLAQVVASLEWTPGPGDPSALHLVVSVWTPPAGPAPGEPKPYKPAGTLPKPASAGCLPSCPTAPVPGGGGVVIAASRQASAIPNGTAIAHPIWGALAVAFNPPLPPAVAVSFSASPPASASAQVILPASTPLFLVVGEAESTIENVDPSTVAAALASGEGAPENAAAAADAFWSEFWSRSWVSLPGAFDLERLWHGAQYALGAGASSDPRVPAPGLFGVWASSDEVGWNGDFTLDYNAESTFYGAFSSNHGPQVEGYFPVISAWVHAARALAVEQAAVYNLSCPSNTLHFACHLAPWGFQSWDQTVYMHWNGHFAVLPFISHWEYTLNASFARNTTYPLLEGLNAWWVCSLNKTYVPPYGPSDYLFHDTAADEEHEKGVSVDPQIALALASRTLGAQLAISTALGIAPLASVADVWEHLAPFNTDRGCNPIGAKWPCGGWNWTPPSGTNATPLLNLSVWTAYGGAPIHNSDSFSLYPLWPAEALGLLPDAPTLERAQNSARAYAKLVGGRPVDTFTSAVLAGQGYTFFGRQGGSVVQRGPAARSVAFSPMEVLEGLAGHMALPCPSCCGIKGKPCGPGGSLWGENLLLYTDGGGVENIGVSRSLNEMLLTSLGGVGGVVTLFPFWPSSQPAAFKGLMVKGGLQLAAAYDNATNAIASPFSIISLGPTPAHVRLADPWGKASVSVDCGSAYPVPVTWESSYVCVFELPLGGVCTVALGAGHKGG